MPATDVFLLMGILKGVGTATTTFSIVDDTLTWPAVDSDSLTHPLVFDDNLTWPSVDGESMEV